LKPLARPAQNEERECADRLRASSRDGEMVMTESPSPLTMLLLRHTKRRDCLAARRQPGRWNTRAQQPAMPVTNYLASSREAGDKANL
jgi:hypothetical protein